MLQIDDNSFAEEKRCHWKFTCAILFFQSCVCLVGWKEGQLLDVWVFLPSNLNFKNDPGDYQSPSDAELPMALLHHK